jgi:hypothetical protein
VLLMHMSILVDNLLKPAGGHRRLAPQTTPWRRLLRAIADTPEPGECFLHAPDAVSARHRRLMRGGEIGDPRSFW